MHPGQILPTLLEAGLRVETMEWWTNGFTERTPFLNAVKDGAKPWDKCIVVLRVSIQYIHARPGARMRTASLQGEFLSKKQKYCREAMRCWKHWLDYGMTT